MFLLSYIAVGRIVIVVIIGSSDAPMAGYKDAHRALCTTDDNNQIDIASHFRNNILG